MKSSPFNAKIFKFPLCSFLKLKAKKSVLHVQKHQSAKMILSMLKAAASNSEAKLKANLLTFSNVKMLLSSFQ